MGLHDDKTIKMSARERIVSLRNLFFFKGISDLITLKISTDIVEKLGKDFTPETYGVILEVDPGLPADTITYHK